MVFANVLMCILSDLGPIRSCDSDLGPIWSCDSGLGPIRSCDHGKNNAVCPWFQPWIPIKTKWLTKSISVFQVYITIIPAICEICDSKTVLKLMLVIYTHYLKATGLHSEYNFSSLVFKWLTPSNGGSVLDKV